MLRSNGDDKVAFAYRKGPDDAWEDLSGSLIAVDIDVVGGPLGSVQISVGLIVDYGLMY